MRDEWRGNERGERGRERNKERLLREIKERIEEKYGGKKARDRKGRRTRDEKRGQEIKRHDENCGEIKRDEER